MFRASRRTDAARNIVVVEGKRNARKMLTNESESAIEYINQVEYHTRIPPSIHRHTRALVNHYAALGILSSAVRRASHDRSRRTQALGVDVCARRARAFK